MIWKGMAVFAVVLALQQMQLQADGQTGAASTMTPVAAGPDSIAAGTTGSQTAGTKTPGRQGAGSPEPAGAEASGGSAGAKQGCEGAGCEVQPTHITVANPVAAALPETLRDRITWGAVLVLILLGYAGVLLGLSTLKKIERQTGYAEQAAQAAAESAQAALLQAEAMVRAERPWVLVSFEPSRKVENGFIVIATNRGRSPARIVEIVDETRIAAEEADLPEVPRYAEEKADSPAVPIVLLPGEFTALKSFGRGDVKELCATEDQLRRVENWEERVFLYGKVVYRDLTAPANRAAHETAWCFRYIHGKQKSGMATAGPQRYNVHS